MSYPEPQELREFAQEPMPFHEIHASDLELLDNDRIRVGYENVEYVYHPTYLRVEFADGEHERHEYPDWEYVLEDVWNDGVDWEIQEDFICVTMLSDHRYEAYWVLEEITIENPSLYS